jgi:hypothetical protein
VIVATSADQKGLLLMKQRLKAKKLPVEVYEVKGKKKPLFVVKVGPLSEKQAKELARRLKSEMRLAYTPTLEKMAAPAPKAAPRKPRP